MVEDLSQISGGEKVGGLRQQNKRMKNGKTIYVFGREKTILILLYPISYTCIITNVLEICSEAVGMFFIPLALEI